MVNTAYVLSSGHSGSTLLDLLIGSHPEAMSLGEVTYLPRSFVRSAVCTCGAPVPQCEFWLGVMEEMGAKLGVDLIADPYALDLGMMLATHHVDQRKQTRSYVARWKLIHGLAIFQYRYGLDALALLTRRLATTARNNHQLFDVVRRRSQARLVVDSSKSYVKGVALYRSRPDQVRLILSSRDGRGVMHSRLKRGVPRETAVSIWRNYYQRTLPLVERAVAPDHLFRIRYEDLTANPSGELTRLCDFLGIAFHPNMLNFSSKVHHMPEGNDMRMAGAAIRADTAWKSALDESDLAYFERTCGDLNRRLGYS
jgi:hypothetical protein